MINGNQLFALACALSLGVSSTAFAADAGDAKKGQDAFMRYHCYVCHGTEGKGNPALGAPNLSDRIWLHGGGVAAVVEAINKGRGGQMPAFKESLGEGKVHLLAAYIYSLSHPVAGGSTEKH